MVHNLDQIEVKEMAACVHPVVFGLIFEVWFLSLVQYFVSIDLELDFHVPHVLVKNEVYDTCY